MTVFPPDHSILLLKWLKPRHIWSYINDWNTSFGCGGRGENGNRLACLRVWVRNFVMNFNFPTKSEQFTCCWLWTLLLLQLKPSKTCVVFWLSMVLKNCQDRGQPAKLRQDWDAAAGQSSSKNFLQKWWTIRCQKNEQKNQNMSAWPGFVVD